jgi:hypothetical protein
VTRSSSWSSKSRHSASLTRSSTPVSSAPVARTAGPGPAGRHSPVDAPTRPGASGGDVHAHPEAQLAGPADVVLDDLRWCLVRTSYGHRDGQPIRDLGSLPGDQRLQVGRTSRLAAVRVGRADPTMPRRAGVHRRGDGGFGVVEALRGVTPVEGGGAPAAEPTSMPAGSASEARRWSGPA